ncbi:MAG: HpcH/HpaI aldolase/citrate lyase family protein [Bacillota bacterium]
MRYFDYLNEEQQHHIFCIKPEVFNRDSDKELLSYALGAALYMPGTRETLSQDIIDRKYPKVKSLVFCLEDAIGDHEVQKAEENVVNHLRRLTEAVKKGEIDYQNIPLIFLRIRSPQQLVKIVDKGKEYLTLLTGFAFPKFTHLNGEAFFDTLSKANKSLGKVLYGMPILETPEIIYKELRMEALDKIHEILDKYYDLVLNIRIGATDFTSLFGVRRTYDMTIYDMVVIRECIGDILNKFCRAKKGYVLSAPVWEYFHNGDRVLKPQLRQTPFTDTYGPSGAAMRVKMLNKYIDGLMREVLMDKANGFIGKTIIHPSHITPVQALYVVSHEEYMDASGILDNNHGGIGVFKSKYENKMNEIKPHLNWAKKTMMRAKIYGVFHEQQNFTSLLT